MVERPRIVPDEQPSALRHPLGVYAVDDVVIQSRPVFGSVVVDEGGFNRFDGHVATVPTKSSASVMPSNDRTLIPSQVEPTGCQNKSPSLAGPML